MHMHARTNTHAHMRVCARPVYFKPILPCNARMSPPRTHSAGSRALALGQAGAREQVPLPIGVSELSVGWEC